MAKNGIVANLQMVKLLAGCLFFAREAKSGWIPVNGHILDAAIKSAREKGAFPPWGKKGLHFANGRTGLVCIELEELLDLMCQYCLLEYDSTFCRARFLVSERVIRSLLKEIGVDGWKARKWGRFIREGLEMEKRLTFGDPGDS